MTPDAEKLRDRLGGLTDLDRHRLGRRLTRARSAADLAAVGRSVAAGEELVAARSAGVPAVTYPESLPVSGRRDDILDAIRRHQVVVVAGETGSGKTTQLPKMCLELGRGVRGTIGHTQPRRIAARTVAERLAEELGVPLGAAVGYAVRFDDRVSDTTLVKVMTDGILLAEIQRDRRLLAYDTIIVDEAHERSLNIDFLLGYLTQLLPRRPDLKVIVTSATIDTGRFASHFDAPVVEVSGRTYPVEIRYRPVVDDTDGDTDGPADGRADGRADATPGGGGRGGAGRVDRDRDQGQAICDAVAELAAEGPGDVLVFLAGERDIRDAADALREAGVCGDDSEVLPLYARLSAAEQHMVFKAHRGRRVVLSTNVAETSLTVPGVRYVVDTGTARISRYSHRTKVQRLPIEPVSQASANQRAGRCGRVAPGICIRLYAEEDFAGRPAFTDPEILRTNLASVILQMTAIGLGDVEAFPFVEPPDRRSVADGVALLEELGAFAAAAERGGSGPPALSPVGRRLAQLPLDPRIGRMVVEAQALDCLREVTVIAAALSIQDPRERPADKAQAADESHRRFTVPGSDFLGMVALWDHLGEQQAAMSGNQFRRWCRANYLNVLRVREWQDLAGQIRQVHRATGVRPNREPADAERIHQALLAGLLSHLGVRDRERGDYQGARNARWQVGRRSVVYRKQPPWVMAAELVETERTWARTVAGVDPLWAERLGAHLVKRSYSEPWWDERRAEVVTDERVTLYGLPLVTGRRTGYAKIDPVESRRLFLLHALVDEEWPAAPDFVARTRSGMRQIEDLEDRVRRRDLLAGDEARLDYWDARIPAQVVSGRTFQRWWKEAVRTNAELLDVPLAVLLDRSGGPVHLEDWPDEWRKGDLRLALRYAFTPGESGDGVTAVVPLTALNRLSSEGFDWHVPGLRLELLTALVRTLPKSLRRSLVPAPEVAAAVLAECGPADGPLLDVVARQLSRRSGERVRPEMWDPAQLPDHLRMNFEVVDAAGEVRRSGPDLDALRRELRDEVRDAVAAALPGHARHGERAWVFGDIAREVSGPGGVVGFPSLVDEGEAVGLTVVDTPAAQADGMWRGTIRLLRLAAPLPMAHLQRRLSNDTKLAMARGGIPVAALLDDCTTAALDELVTGAGGPPYSEAGFAVLAGRARARLLERVVSLATIAGGVLAAAEGVERRAGELERRDRTGALQASLADVRRQTGRLVGPGFVAVSGSAHLSDVLRYLEAAVRRLDRLPGEVVRDNQRMAVVQRVESRYERLVDQVVDGTAPPPVMRGLARVRWMIEELRVSLFAQVLGTAGPVSEERISRLLDAMVARA